MNAGLYDVLRGAFGDGTPLDAVPEHEQRLMSVVGNLTHLFNTRRGAVAHLPDYGLPDVASAFRDRPHSADDLRRAVREAVETYEPRLKRIRVEHERTDRHAMHLVFILLAELEEGQRVRFETTFTSQELTTVRPRQRPA